MSRCGVSRKIRLAGFLTFILALSVPLSLAAESGSAHADHAHAQPAAKDTLAVDELTEEDLEADSDSTGALATPKARADSVVLIRHQFNHKEQIIAGGVVMACLVAMMAVMNNYNPR